MVEEDKSYIKAYQNWKYYRYKYLDKSSYSPCRKKIGLTAFGSKNKNQDPGGKEGLKT